MEKKEEIVKDEAVASRVYELGYLLVPTITEETLGAEVNKLKSMIDAVGGIHIADEFPKNIPLAYDMQKVINNKNETFSQAHFGWMKFEVSPEAVIKLKSELDRVTEIIRFLLIKTVRENTLASRRTFSPRGEYAKRKSPQTAAESSEAPVEINKEEVDKKIDEMAAAV